MSQTSRQGQFDIDVSRLSDEELGRLAGSMGVLESVRRRAVAEENRRLAEAFERERQKEQREQDSEARRERERQEEQREPERAEFVRSLATEDLEFLSRRLGSVEAARKAGAGDQWWTLIKRGLEVGLGKSELARRASEELRRRREERERRDRERAGRRPGSGLFSHTFETLGCDDDCPHRRARQGPPERRMVLSSVRRRA